MIGDTSPIHPTPPVCCDTPPLIPPSSTSETPPTTAATATSPLIVAEGGGGGSGGGGSGGGDVKAVKIDNRESLEEYFLGGKKNLKKERFERVYCEEGYPMTRDILEMKDKIIFRLPGEIDGKQLNIKGLTNCDVYLFDRSATMYVDNCENCRFFIGPVEGAIFFRNCQNVDAIVICQQFRTRDCQHCNFSLHVCTDPIIETSTDMKFGPFMAYYDQLQEQMDYGRLSLFTNNWYKVYDFNKNSNDGIQRWNLLSLQQTKQEFSNFCNFLLSPHSANATPPLNFNFPSWNALTFINGLESKELFSPQTMSFITPTPTETSSDEEVTSCLIAFPVYRRQLRPWRPKNSPPAEDPPAPPQDNRPHQVISLIHEYSHVIRVKRATQKNMSIDRINELWGDCCVPQTLTSRCGDKMSMLAILQVDAAGKQQYDEFAAKLESLWSTECTIIEGPSTTEAAECIFIQWKD